MHKKFLTLTAILLITVTTIISASSHELNESQSYILLNNNIILDGKILGFNNGFLFFKQIDKILKISPAHFKGIFSTQNNAENAIIILDEPSNPDPADFINLDKTYSFIYQKAESLINNNTSLKEIRFIFSDLKNKFINPESILDINLYKNLLLLSAVSDHYKLKKDLTLFISNSFQENNLIEININIRKQIEIKIKAIEYLMDHPYIRK